MAELYDYLISHFVLTFMSDIIVSEKTIKMSNFSQDDGFYSGGYGDSNQQNTSQDFSYGQAGYAADYSQGQDQWVLKK